MNERMEMLGQRADLKPKYQMLATECEALRDSLRMLLPVHEEVKQLNGDSIAIAAVALQKKLVELNGMKRKIDILTEQLGCD